MLMLFDSSLLVSTDRCNTDRCCQIGINCFGVAVVLCFLRRLHIVNQLAAACRILAGFALLKSF